MSETYTITAIAPIARKQDAQLEKARAVALRLGALRKDVWAKYGGFKAWGADSFALEREFKLTNPPSMYKTDMKCWNRTFLQVIDDIKMTHAAIRTAVFPNIYRYIPKEQQKDAFNKLKTTEFMTDNRLHRWVRNQSHRGGTNVNSHIVLTHNGGATFQREGRITKITFSGLPIANSNRYEKITLKFRTGVVNLKGYATIIFHDDGVCRLHYPVKKDILQNASTETVGVDKGYTEALFGSDGVAYGAGIGKVMTKASDKLNATGKRRNKLHALAKNTDNAKKKANIIKNNLGRKKLDHTTKAKQNELKSIIRKDVNKLFGKYSRVVCEDLSQHIKSKGQMKRMNRILGNWCKGEIQKSLEEIAMRTGSTVAVVNPAYTSQVNRKNGTLLGTRSGDYFTSHTGEVFHADKNAGGNILDRDSDRDITRYMKAEQVLKVLLNRTACFLEQNGKTMLDAHNLGWLSEKHYAAARKYGIGVHPKGLDSIPGGVSAPSMKPRKNRVSNQAANKMINGSNYGNLS